MANEISSAGSVAQATIPVVSGDASRIERGALAPGKVPPSAGSAEGKPGTDYYGKIDAEYASAQAASDERLDQALGAQQTRQTLDKAGAILDAAEESLTGIVKRYPPYAPDSPERVQLLNQVTGLKKQIEALDFPAEATDEAQKLDPVLNRLLNLGEEVASKIPDEALAALLDEIETARNGISESRAAMWLDLFARDATESEQKAALHAHASQAALAGVEQTISRSPGLLADLA